MTCYSRSSSSILKFCAGTVVTGGLLGLAIFVVGTIAAFAGAKLGTYIDNLRLSEIEKKLKGLSETCQEMLRESARIRCDMQNFEMSFEDQTLYVDQADVSIEGFLSGQHPWETFKTYLAEDIGALKSLKKNQNPTNPMQSQDLMPASSVSDLVTVGGGALAGAAVGAAFADTMGMQSSLAIGGAAAIGGAVGGAAAVASLARPTLKTKAVEEAAP